MVRIIIREGQDVNE
jgi:ankyrin repeat protein